MEPWKNPSIKTLNKCLWFIVRSCVHVKELNRKYVLQAICFLTPSLSYSLLLTRKPSFTGISFLRINILKTGFRNLIPLLFSLFFAKKGFHWKISAERLHLNIMYILQYINLTPVYPHHLFSLWKNLFNFSNSSSSKL